MASRFHRPVIILLAAFMLLISGSPAGASALPPLVKRIQLPGVEGRIDHMAIDVPGQRLFVAAVGNGSIEVVDLAKGERIRSISGLNEPQGVVYDRDVNRIVVACGRDGTCRFYHGQTYELLETTRFDSDADNLRLDAKANRVYVGSGNGEIGALNPVSGTRLMGSDVALPEHPEGFQFEVSGSRLFANLPHSGTVAVVDRATSKLDTIWPLIGDHSNFPMALDEPDHRLFTASRDPSRLIVLNTDHGELIASLPCVGDADDIFYDETSHRVLVSGGEGRIDVFRVQDPDTYVLAGSIPTAHGARTCHLSDELHQLFLAVPHRGNQPAEIRVYDLLAK